MGVVRQGRGACCPETKNSTLSGVIVVEVGDGGGPLRASSLLVDKEINICIDVAIFEDLQE